MEIRITPSRRWYRFSLRTLFVMVMFMGVIAGWLAWNWRIVRERQKLAQRIEELGAEFSIRSGTDTFWINLDRNPMPFPRNWLGDRRAGGIELPPDFPPEEISRIREVFPEAWLSCDEGKADP